MREGRIKVESGEGTAVYHCISRIVAGERLLGPVEQEILRKTLWRVAGFCGVEVLAYCLMSNHMHILVRVPEMRAEDWSRAELLRRYRILYGEGKAGFFPEPEALALLFADPDCAEAARWEARLRVRMNDVSAFMQTLKQRFTIWFNKHHGRFGTLWAERFKSVLVEDAPAVLRVVAAYIDLNPVRAGLVEDPGDYRWSSYGEATGGQRRAQNGLAAACGQSRWAAVRADYRLLLFGKGATGRVGQQAWIPHERVLEVVAQGGKVPIACLLRCRLRYLSDGAILGSRAFVMAMNAQHRSGRRRKVTGKPDRKTSALPSDGPELVAARSLRTDAVS